MNSLKIVLTLLILYCPIIFAESTQDKADLAIANILFDFSLVKLNIQVIE
jgi:hypothetical protein